MNKNQLINQLIEMDSEYLYRDLGYGGFNSKGQFIVQGEVVSLTYQDVKEMYEAEVAPLMAEARREFGGAF